MEQPLEQFEQFIIAGQTEEIERRIHSLKEAFDFLSLYDHTTLLYTYGFFEEARDLFEWMRTHLDDEPRLLVDEALVRFELNDEQRAIDLLQRVKLEDEEYLQALLIFADYYESTGMIELAFEKMQQAYDIAPHEPVIQFGYGQVLQLMGKNLEAIRMYEQLVGVEDFPQDRILHNLAYAYQSGADFESALPYFEQLLESEETPDVLFSYSYALFQTEQYERAKEQLNRCLAIDPDYYSAYTLLGQTEGQLGRLQAAYDAFTAGIARDAYEPTLRLAAGKMAIKLGKLDEAITQLSEGLAIDPEHVEARETLASIYDEQEMADEQQDLLADDALMTPFLHYMRAKNYEREEAFKEAAKEYAQAAKDLKEDVHFLHDYASFLIEEGAMDEAKNRVEQLLKIQEDPVWQQWLEEYEERWQS